MTEHRFSGDPFLEADKSRGHRDSPLNPAHVDEVFKACLEGIEVNADGSLPHTAITVKGIAHTAVFSRAKLAEHHDEIGAMLDQLPVAFKARSAGGGDGWSFLNMCNDRDGQQWTDLHLVMEMLFMLGVGSGQARYCFEDREMWASLPGGMPYVMTEPYAGMPQ